MGAQLLSVITLGFIFSKTVLKHLEFFKLLVLYYHVCHQNLVLSSISGTRMPKKCVDLFCVERLEKGAAKSYYRE